MYTPRVLLMFQAARQIKHERFILFQFFPFFASFFPLCTRNVHECLMYQTATFTGNEEGFTKIGWLWLLQKGQNNGLTSNAMHLHPYFTLLYNCTKRIRDANAFQWRSNPCFCPFCRSPNYPIFVKYPLKQRLIVASFKSITTNFCDIYIKFYNRTCGGLILIVRTPCTMFKFLKVLGSRPFHN